MPELARKLGLWNYFALGFGTMIGTGWVVLMDDWLSRGGPFGAMWAYAIGGVLLLPVAYIFPQLDTFELYRVAGQPVFLPRLLLGAALTFGLAVLNYHGIRASAIFQNWATTSVLG